MKIICIIFLFQLSQQSSILGEKATQRFLPKNFSWLKKQDLSVDQRAAFESIQQTKEYVEKELQEEIENNEFLQIFHNQILNLSYEREQLAISENSQIEQFLFEEIKRGVNYFNNVIKEKEKNIFQDIKEIEKIKKQTHDSNKLQTKLIEVRTLLTEIQSGLDIGTSDKLYKILEIIEAKAVMGLFAYQQEYVEVEQYLKNVDSIFRSRNFQKDQIEIVNLISTVRNILLDMELNILVKIQDKNIEEQESLAFFENTKQVHSLAKDYFTKELHKFQETLLNQWEQIYQTQQEIVQDSHSYNLLLQQLSQENNKIIENILQNYEIIKSDLKHIEHEYLQKQSRV